MIGETTARLRTATATAHQRLEDDLDIFGKVAGADSRRRLVERFHGLHVGAERALSPWLHDIDGLVFGERSRLPALDRDLKALGATVAGLVPVCAVASPASVAEALGMLYVLEGSTLGGHVIGRRMASEGLDRVGLTFLDPYGARVGERWRDFLAVLERETASDAAREAAATGARRAFAVTHDWLCAEVVAA